MRHIIVFLLSLSVTSCGQIQSSNIEKIESNDRLFRTKKMESNDRLFQLSPDLVRDIENIESNDTSLIPPTSPQKVWVKLIEGSDLMYLPSEEKYGRELSISYNGSPEKLCYDWNEDIKKYIESLPLNTRDSVVKIIAPSVKCHFDELEKRIYFRRGISKTADQDGGVTLFMEASIQDNTIKATLNITYWHGYEHTRLNLLGIKIYTDKKSLNLDVEVDNSLTRTQFIAQERAILELTNKKNLSIMQSFVDSNKSVIRLLGSSYYFNFTPSEEDKKILKMGLEMISDINNSTPN